MLNSLQIAEVVTAIHRVPEMTGIKVGNNPSDVAINPNTNMLYVANSLSNTVSVIDGSSIVANVTVGSNPSYLAQEVRESCAIELVTRQ